MGYLDGEGYLYLADRCSDLIISSGSNVYPAEVEAVLSAHPQVRDAVVIGLPDDDLGRRVHAVIEATGDSPGEDGLRSHCADKLAWYKVPRSFEFVASPVAQRSRQESPKRADSQHRQLNAHE